MDKDTFLNVIKETPFVSIDLVLRNERGQVLLGYRRNRPAQHSWFVPGGRIRKNETAQDALRRIAQNELGMTLPEGRVLGVFDHIYEDNYFNEPGIGTHYVVIPMEFRIPGDTRFRGDDQHARLKWWTVEELLGSDEVHENTKLYFRDVPDNGFRCG